MNREELMKLIQQQAEYVRKNIAGEKIKSSGKRTPYKRSIDIIREKRAAAKAKAAAEAAKNKEENQ